MTFYRSLLDDYQGDPAMPQHILTAAKAYAALVGAIVTAVLGTVPPHTTVWTVLTVVAAVATAVVTYAVPNAATGPQD